MISKITENKILEDTSKSIIGDNNEKIKAMTKKEVKKSYIQNNLKNKPNIC